VPDVWQRASPESLVTARSEAAAKTLTRLFPSIAGVAAKTNEELHRAIGRCGVGGRPLFAANRQVELPDDPVATFWQLCTSLREHRGDGHVAALTAAGLDGIEAHVLISLDQGTEPGDLQRTRGWTAHDWSEAVERCQARRLVNPARHLSDTGRALRHNIEATTDRLASSAWHGVAERDRDALIAMLTPAAKAVSNSGLIRYPNPIGLPAID
jgi:DNA-binding MarR family transcriptional regulator